MPAQPWRNGGGVTRELLAWPGGRVDWQLRISVADIDADGPFSRFPGVERWFAVLEGAGVELTIAGAVHRLVRGDAPLHFDGAAPAHARLIDGPTRDLNLMLRNAGGTMQCVADGAALGSPCGGPLRPVQRRRGALPGRRPGCHRGRRLRIAVVRRRSFIVDLHRRATAGGPDRLVACRPGAEGLSVATLWRNARLTTLATPAGWGLLERAAMVVEGERLIWVGAPSRIATHARHRRRAAILAARWSRPA